MKRLSMLDAAFLYLESPETPMHVASVTTFKPSGRQENLFERFREHTAARLDLLSSYRRRLEATPLGLDHPVWVVDDKLDLDHHIRHHALPKPGGMEELRALVAQLHAIPLDRTRPLWEYHFIEGLEDGGFAVYAKIHHCGMDGLAGMSTLSVLFDFEPGAEEESLRERTFPPDAETNDFIELTSTAVGDFIRQGWRAAKALPGVALSLSKTAPNLARDARFLYSHVKDMPRTPFNKAISGHRAYATSSLPLPDVKTLGKSRGVTINDVVLALCAGALRRYLIEHAALPAKPLTAGVPVSLRPPGDKQLNNQVVFTLSHLPTDVAEPLQRLAAAQAAGKEAKDLSADIRDFFPTDVSIMGAPLVVTALAKLWAGGRAANYTRPFLNVIISNVPGPRQPMYCVGAQATHNFPASIPYHGSALNITVHSYLDQLDFGLIACSEAVPDAQRIADLIVEEFEALRKADAELARPETVETTAVPKPAAAPRHESIQFREGAATEPLKRKLAEATPNASPARSTRSKPKIEAERGKTATPRPAKPASSAGTSAGTQRSQPKAAKPSRATARRKPRTATPSES